MVVGLVAAATGTELVQHGVLPGKSLLNELDGACDVEIPPLDFAPLGPSRSGNFYSASRQREVGFSVAWPPGHGPGDALPLVVMLHGYGGDHLRALSGMTPAQAVALRVDGAPLAPMGIVTVDGGDGYWNPHPGDNPMAMVFDELIPMCQDLGLGRPPQRVGTMGISMGGYGALLFAERYPSVVAAVAAISPAIWTTYDEARSVNPGAYASAADFAADDVIIHASEIQNKPVRVVSGASDPFHSGVEALARALPRDAQVTYPSGCHTGPFFLSQEPPSLAFLSEHLRGDLLSNQ